MKFGSWTFEGKTLVYQFQGSNIMDLTDYMKNGAWDIIDCPGHISHTRDSITGQVNYGCIAQHTSCGQWFSKKKKANNFKRPNCIVHEPQIYYH